MGESRLFFHGQGGVVEVNEITNFHEYKVPSEGLNLRTVSVKQDIHRLIERASKSFDVVFVDNLSRLNAAQKKDLKRLLNKHSKIFSDVPGLTHLYEHKIKHLLKLNSTLYL